MDKKQLEKRRKKAENNFNDLQKEKSEHQTRIQEIDTELLRIQGEYRLISSLLEEDVSVKADTIDATKVKGA